MPDGKHDSTKLGPAIFDAHELARRLARYGEEHTFPAATHGAQLLDALAVALALASRGDGAAEQAIKLAAAKLSHAIEHTPRVRDPKVRGPIAEALRDALAGYLEAEPTATAGKLATILARHAGHVPGGHRVFPADADPVDRWTPVNRTRIGRWTLAIEKALLRAPRGAQDRAEAIVTECARADGMRKPSSLFNAASHRTKRGR